MFNYVQVINGVVVGVQQSQNEITDEQYFQVEKYDLSLLGKLTGDGVIFTEAPEQAIREISYRAFRERFELSELIKIEESTEAVVKVLEKDLQARGMENKPVRLDSEKLIDGLNIYADKGLIYRARIAQLLADGTIEEVL